MRNYADRTGRFSQRPHFKPQELDRMCEKLITNFLKELYAQVKFPVSTDDLTTLIEREARDLDMYADLSIHGPKVEGVTEFQRGKKPSVKIASQLTEESHRENRLRTTLSHEYGHVHLHRYLFEIEERSGELFRDAPVRNDKVICKRDTMLDARQSDWMEWQACYFSGSLLMPASYIKKVVQAFKDSESIESVMDGGNDFRNLVESIQGNFQVSAEAARVRLLKLGLIASLEAEKTYFPDKEFNLLQAHAKNDTLISISADRLKRDPQIS